MADKGGGESVSYDVETYNVIQIMPAEPGWKAMFRGEKGEPMIEEDVVMWAVTQCRTEHRVREGVSSRLVNTTTNRNMICGVGVSDTGMDVFEKVSNFVAYKAPGQTVDDFARQYG